MDEKEIDELRHWAKHYGIAFNRGFGLGSLVGFGTATVMLLVFIWLTYM